MQMKAVFLGLPLALLACTFASAEPITCSRLLNSDNVGEADKVKGQLCQLYTVAKVADAFLDSLSDGLSEMLTSQGVINDISVDDNGVETNEVAKRKNDFLRFGKRKNDFLRFGKRKNDFLRFGKRKNDFLRFGKSAYPEDYIKSKLGKRMYNYVRDMMDMEADLNQN